MNEYDEMYEVITQRLAQLEQYRSELQNNAAQPTNDHLCAYRHGKSIQYYKVSPIPSELAEQKRTYLGKDKYSLAVDIAQAEYNARLTKAIDDEVATLTPCKKLYKKLAQKGSYLGITELKRPLITTIRETDQQYRERWEQVSFQQKGFAENDPIFLTQKKERVRSKSEILIANLLYQLDIPYRYECALTLYNNKIVFPDFTILDVRCRREIYLEHFGIMDNPDYARTMVFKVSQYEKSGIFPNDNLLMTFETQQQPIDLVQLEQMLKLQLKLN